MFVHNEHSLLFANWFGQFVYSNTQFLVKRLATPRRHAEEATVSSTDPQGAIGCRGHRQ